MKRFSTIYQKLAVIILNSLLLFFIVNLIALCIDGPLYHKRSIQSVISNKQMLIENPALMQQLYGGKSVNTIIAILAESPNVKSHPVLQFMTQPVSGSYFNTGFEGCRYNSLVNNHNAAQYVNGGSWLLGGSTAFGFGLPDDETLGYFLNQLDTNNHWINFATPSYHQKLEIEKMILLLQKGYRPKRVIFLDGLNDLTKLVSSQFEPAETPGKPFHAFSHEFSVENLKINKNLLYTLPIVRLYYEYRAEYLIKKLHSDTSVSEDIYNSSSLYHTQPYLFYLIQEGSNKPVTPALLEKTAQYYLQNLDLIDNLSKAYGFEYTVFFQPNGIFYTKNVFAASQQLLVNNLHNYAAIQAMHKHIKHLVAQRTFKHFYDISSLDQQCSNPYIDLTHYSMTMNKLLAHAMLNCLTEATDTTSHPQE